MILTVEAIEAGYRVLVEPLAPETGRYSAQDLGQLSRCQTLPR